MYLVQVGRNKSAYKTRYAFKDQSRALLYFYSINIGNGYKKRLVHPDGKVLIRDFS